MTVEEKIEQKIAALIPAFEQIPGAVIIHHLSPATVIYMNGYGLKGLGMTLDEVRQMGMEYYERFFNAEEAAEYVPKLMGLIERNNNEELVSLFQQVKTNRGNGWQWHVCGTKIFMHDDDGKPYATISVAIPIDRRHHLTDKVDRLLQENMFLKSHSALFASLGKREKEILRLMARDISSTVIAQQLHLSEETVKTHRRNIKKKLQAKNQYDIVRFAQAFSLV